MDIRQATSNDNETLQHLMAQCPQGSSLIITLVNTPNFFARAQAYETYRVFVAQDGAAIMGSAACAVRQVQLNGASARVGYEFQYFTAPAYRRQGVAACLHQHIEAYLREQQAEWSSLLIVPGNVASTRLFEGQGFYLHRNLMAAVILVYQQVRLTGGGQIRAATPDDLPAVARLMNETWADHAFYAPATADSLRQFIARVPAYSLDNLLLLEEQGELLACAGVWDMSQVIQVTVNALNSTLSFTGWLLDLARLIRPMPHIPHAGEQFKQWALTPLAFKQPAHLNVLLREINNRACRSGIGQIVVAMGERNQPLWSGLGGLISIRSAVNLHVKPLKPSLKMDDRPVFVDMVDF